MLTGEVDTDGNEEPSQEKKGKGKDFSKRSHVWIAFKEFEDANDKTMVVCFIIMIHSFRKFKKKINFAALSCPKQGRWNLRPRIFLLWQYNEYVEPLAQSV
jgi:hypothetical protein